MSIETHCPPHLAALDDRGVLVCTLCDQRIERPCLAHHVCDLAAGENLVGPAILVLIALFAVLLAAVSGAS
jgi:hypothetical protein